MTSKEIAKATMREIMATCDLALGYGFWQAKAESSINDMFHVARTYRKSITAVTKEFVILAEECSDREGYLLICAISKILGQWLAYKWIRGYEVDRARFMLRAQ